VIDNHIDDEREAIYLYLSENDDTSTHKKTEEEKLGQMITYLRVAFERDVRNNKEKGSKYEEHQEINVKYSEYCIRLAQLNDGFKGNNAAYRRLTFMKSFVLSLVMASRVRRHYQHASWFGVTSFNKMLDVHGGVSEISRDTRP
jgi:hypothetical protein